MLFRSIGTIATDITIDYLTLDDDDGTLANGTPNYNSINTAFSIHGLPGPGLSPLLFTYPNGVPTSVGHYGFTPLVVQVDPLSSQPNLNTVRLYSKATTASTWTISSMIAVAGTTNRFTVNIPGGNCGDIKAFYVACNTTSGAVVTDPLTAPTAFKSATISCSDPLPSDLNGDGHIDGSDLGIMLANWGQRGAGDLNNDGIVDGADLGILLVSWG